jgi:hypothetical protein
LFLPKASPCELQTMLFENRRSCQKIRRTAGVTPRSVIAPTRAFGYSCYLLVPSADLLSAERDFDCGFLLSTQHSLLWHLNWNPPIE